MLIHVTIFHDNPRELHTDAPGLASEPDDENPLLDEIELLHSQAQTNTTTMTQLFLSPELHRPLMIVSFAMLSQQISGMILTFNHSFASHVGLPGINAGRYSNNREGHNISLSTSPLL